MESTHYFKTSSSLVRDLNLLMTGYFENTAIKPEFRIFKFISSKFYNSSKKILNNLDMLTNTSDFSKSKILIKELSNKRTLTEEEYTSIQINLNLDLFNFYEKIKFKDFFEKKEVSLQDFNTWKNKFSNKKVKRNILQIREILRKSSLIKEILLSGSFASNDYISKWSDVDIIIVMNQESKYYTETKFKELRYLFQKAEKLIYKIDPLQHHTFFVISETSFNNYSESYFFPISMLENSVPLLNKLDKISFRYKNYFDISFKKFENKILFFKNLQNVSKFQSNPYLLKDLISQALNIPFTYLNAKGIYCSKKDSFKLAKNLLKTNHWKNFSKWEEMRINWGNSMYIPKFINSIETRQIYFRLFLSKPTKKEEVDALNYLVAKTCLLLDEMKKDIGTKKNET